MFRKAAPFVLLLACALCVAAGVSAQDSGAGRTANSPISQLREFILGDDDSQTPPTHDAKSPQSSASDSRSSNAPQQQQQQQQAPTSSRNDWSGDRKLRSQTAPDQAPTAAKQKTGGLTNAPASPYKYTGQFADADSVGETKAAPTNAPSSRRTAAPMSAGTRGDQSAPAGDASAAPVARANNKSVQDRLSGVQSVTENQAPVVSVPAQADDTPKSAPTTARRTVAAKTAAPPSTGAVDPAVPTPRTARVETIERKPVAVAQKPAAPKSEPAGDAILFTHQNPLVAVETTGPKTISIGKEATYVVSVQNAGDVPAQELVVTIKVPAWADVVGARSTTGSTQPGAQPGDPYQWHVTRLEAHGKEQLSLKLVPRQSRPFDLGVQWTFSPVASQALVEVQEPKLVLDLVGPKEVSYGQTKVFRLTLANPGNGDAENVIIKLLPLGDRKDTGASHQLGTLPAGESKVIEVELTARDTGMLNIRAEAVADGGLRAEVADEVLVRRAGLQVAIDSPKVKYSGTPATYVLHVTNPGNATAENVQLAATLPSGAKFISCSTGGQLATDQTTVNWTLGTLRSGSDTTLEIKCLLSQPGANQFQVVSTAADELSTTAGSTTQVEALADLKLDIVDPQGPVAVGEEASYEVHIRNRGTKTAEQIEIISFFSAGMEPIAAQGGQFEIGRGQIAFAPIPALPAGNELVLKIKATADRPGSHVFRTEVVCRSLESKLASEVTTRFYGDEAPVNEAQKPTPAIRRTSGESPVPLIPLPKSEPSEPARFFPPNGN